VFSVLGVPFESREAFTELGQAVHARLLPEVVAANVTSAYRVLQ
jgi:hypothetical protein